MEAVARAMRRETSAAIMAAVKMRLLTYNILKGGEGREAEIVEVIRAAAPDVVVVPEVRGVERFWRIAAALGMAPHLAEGRGRIPLRVGLLSRLPILSFRTLHLWPVWPGCIEATVQPADGFPLTVYGVHLAAYYPWFLEWWRARQVRALLRHVRRTAPGDRHLLAGDFNAVAPGDRVSLAGAPLWVRTQTWFQLGRLPRRALKPLLDAGYVDCFREMHPQEDGFTLPSTGPQVRLDYVFAAPPLAGALSGCRVVTEPAVAASASDHLPVMAEFGLEC
jgi:endonuclease/exonuclease/phosphatase family metal-dependent hydrolase